MLNDSSLVARFVIKMQTLCLLSFFFFFNDTATTEIYTLSLHDALPISPRPASRGGACHPYFRRRRAPAREVRREWRPDRKSTRLNSSHANISYAVFCLKKKKKQIHTTRQAVRAQYLAQSNTHAPRQLSN